MTPDRSLSLSEPQFPTPKITSTSRVVSRPTGLHKASLEEITWMWGSNLLGGAGVRGGRKDMKRQRSLLTPGVVAAGKATSGVGTAGAWGGLSVLCLGPWWAMKGLVLPGVGGQGWNVTEHSRWAIV